MNLFDEVSERSVVQILWEETVAFGPERGRELLQRAALEPADFTVTLARDMFVLLRGAVGGGLVPIASCAEQTEYLRTDEVQNPFHLDARANALRELAMRRALVRVAQSVHRDAAEPELSVPEILARAKGEIDRVPTRGDHWRPLTETFERVHEHMSSMRIGGKAPGVLTGFDEIDDETGGFPPTLVVIAAMPGVGKSAFVGSVLRNIAIRGESAAVFCMEDRSEWLGFRVLAHDTGIHQFILRNRVLTGGQWDRVGEMWNSITGFSGRVLCDDREGLTPAEVLFAARAAVRHRGAQAIFLDNMTAMRFERSGRLDLEIQDFLVAARALANEMQVPFVVLSHVKRRDDLDVGDMPRLTDCSETSAFEKLCRLAYGLSREKKTDALKIAVLKNTNGRAHMGFTLALRPSSALVEAEERKAKQEGLDL